MRKNVKYLLGKNITCFEDIDVIESKIGSVKSSKNEQFVSTDCTSRMIRPFQRHISSTRNWPPFDVFLDDFDCVDLLVKIKNLIVREDLSVLFVRLIDSSEHDGKLAHSSDRVTRTGSGGGSSMIQLNPF